MKKEGPSFVFFVSHRIQAAGENVAPRPLLSLRIGRRWS